MLKDGKRKKILRTKKTHKKNIEEEDGLRKKISHEKLKRDFSLLHKAKVKEELPKERKEHMPKQSQSNENAVSFIFLLY